MAVLILEVGVNFVRSVLVSETTESAKFSFVTTAQRKFELDSTEQGKSWFHPAELRWLLEECIDDTLLRDDADQIEAVCMTFFGSHWMAAAGMDEFYSTGFFTQFDSRSFSIINGLREKIDKEALHQRTGVPLQSSSVSVQIAWFQKEHANWWQIENPYAIEDFGTYCYSAWFDGGARPLCSHAMASIMGLLDRSRLDWDSEWIEYLDISLLMSEIIDHTHTRQGLSRLTGYLYAERWSLLDQVPFYLPMPAIVARQVALGAIELNTVALSLGETIEFSMWERSNDKPIPNECWCYQVDHENSLRGFTIPVTTTRLSSSNNANTTQKDIFASYMEELVLRIWHLSQLLSVPQHSRVMVVMTDNIIGLPFVQMIADCFGQVIEVVESEYAVVNGMAQMTTCHRSGRSLTPPYIEVKDRAEPRREFTTKYAELKKQYLDSLNRIYPSDNQS